MTMNNFFNIYMPRKACRTEPFNISRSKKIDRVLVIASISFVGVIVAHVVWL